MARNLTETYIRNLKPAEDGQRYFVADAVVPGLKLRVTGKGKKVFVLWKRFGGSPYPTARSIGTYGVLTLAEARAKARAWLLTISSGEDPRALEKARREAESERRDMTFGSVMEDYLRLHVAKTRKATDVTREIRKELLPRWKDKPLSEVTRRDVKKMIAEILERGATYQAHHCLGHARTFFNWAIDEEIYGIESSPCERIKPKKAIGEKKPRQRVLKDPELKALWAAADSLGYPMGPLYRMLMLTGQRKGEVAGAQWREFDLAAKVWTIPPERFKSDAVHRVPLSDAVMAVLAELPSWAGGDFLFSSTDGRIPVNGFSKAKARLDKAMGDPDPFVIHDIRRTVRTRLSGLKVPHEVAEMVIGHGKKGLARIYDQHEYQNEMRAALDAWALRLQSIVDPRTAYNVVTLEKKA